MKQNRLWLLALLAAMGGMLASCTSDDDMLSDIAAETS